MAPLDIESGLQQGAGPYRTLTWGAGSIVPGDQAEGSHSYLITAGLVAACAVTDRARSICVGFLGAGWLVGPEANLPGTKPLHRALTAVRAVAIPSPDLLRTMRRSPGLRDAYSAQIQERLAGLHHAAACNAHHALPARCAHWLLELHERLGVEMLPVTHVGLASLLGVRRAGVTVTLGKLQTCGAIRQQRGRIIVTDANQLRAHACACPIGGGADADLLGLLDEHIAAGDGPRDWVAREMRTYENEGHAGDSQWMRREAALRVCRSVLSRGHAVLER